MTTTADPTATPGTPGRRRIHRAWTVAAVTFVALVAAAAFRSSTGVLLEPVEAEFGWSRVDTAGAVSLNLVVYGLTAPFAAALTERFGVERAGVMFGWVFASHMVGAGLAAEFAGAVRVATGSYATAWWTAGTLCLVAAAAIMTIAPAVRPARVVAFDPA